jgi:hypothetical protein
MNFSITTGSNDTGNNIISMGETSALLFLITEGVTERRNEEYLPLHALLL